MSIKGWRVASDVLGRIYNQEELMSLRLWTVGSKGEILRPTSLVLIPQGMPLAEGPDYVLSRTHAKALGVNLPRREVLVGLAATMAATAMPVRPAQAVPGLAAIAIAAVAVGAAAMSVFKPTFGSFQAKNDDDDRVKGYVTISVTDVRTDEREGTITAFYI